MTCQADPPLCRISWPRTYRIIASRYPPIDLFERLADPADWDVLIAIEELTDPRLRQQVGEISLVPVHRRITGPGASYVMAAFSHLNRAGSRFSDGSYGVYYAAQTLKGAIAETVYHMGRIYAAGGDPPHRTDFRVLVGSIDQTFHDARGAPEWRYVHHPDNYQPSQHLAGRLRKAGSNGIAYDSVRLSGGENIAAFWPDVVGKPKEANHLQYDWDGQRIVRYFDYENGNWWPIPAVS